MAGLYLTWRHLGPGWVACTQGKHTPSERCYRPPLLLRLPILPLPSVPPDPAPARVGPHPLPVTPRYYKWLLKHNTKWMRAVQHGAKAVGLIVGKDPKPDYG